MHEIRISFFSCLVVTDPDGTKGGAMKSLAASMARGMLLIRCYQRDRSIEGAVELLRFRLFVNWFLPKDGDLIALLTGIEPGGPSDGTEDGG